MVLAIAALGGAGCSKETPPDAPDGGIGSVCVDNGGCGGGLVCAAGHCQEPGSAGLGGPCWANRDCEDGLYCTIDGVCGPAGTGIDGDACITGGECAPDQYCDLRGFSGTCRPAGSGDVGEACQDRGDCIGGLVCAEDGTCQHPTVAYPPDLVDCAPDETPFRAYFEVPRAGQVASEFYRLPFPNDIRVSPSGELDTSGFVRPGPGLLGVDLVALYLDAWASDFSGFGAIAPVHFRFSAPFDGQTVDPVIVDVTPNAPEYGQTLNAHYRASTGVSERYICQNYVAVRTAAHRPLLPGHTYAFYIPSTVRGADGATPAIDPDFAAVLGATRPSDPALGAAWDRYQPLRDYLDDPTSGVDASSLATASVITVADTVGRGKALADAALATAAPQLADLTLCDGNTTSPCESADGRGACSPVSPDFFEIHGRIAVPFYQRGTPPFETAADGGDIVFAGGVPEQVGTQDVCFALTIPKNAAMPQTGWPLLVAAHGTGGSFTGAVRSGLADTLATSSSPAAVLSYDGVVHGSRKNGSDQSSEELMFNLVNPLAARDNHAQGLVDVVTMLRLSELGVVSLPGAGDVQFDAAKRFFFGHSQGSNVGIPAVAVADQVAGAVFSGAGAHLSRGLITKTSPVASKRALELLIGEPLYLEHPVLGVIQNLMAPVEIASYAPLLINRPESLGLSPKNVWMSYGAGDTFSPPETLAVTALAAGLPVVQPAIDDLHSGLVSRPVSQNRRGSVFGACFQYQPDGYDGHFVASQDPQAVADWAAFFASLIATGVATVN